MFLHLALNWLPKFSPFLLGSTPSPFPTSPLFELLLTTRTGISDCFLFSWSMLGFLLTPLLISSVSWFYYRSVCWWLPCFDLQPKSIPWIPCCLLNNSLWIPNNIIWDAVCPRLNWTYHLSHKPLPVFWVRQGCQLVPNAVDRSSSMMTKNWLLDLPMWEVLTNRETFESLVGFKRKWEQNWRQ